jgi:tRNA pseudouridine38-40 synthase
MKYRMTIEYDGTDFSGWQRQAGATSIQQSVEEALATALRRPAAVVGAGRTDAGVHARGQVAHFETDPPIDPHRLQASLNGLLPPAIAVRQIDRAPDAFHARYDATARVYHYYISFVPVALERSFRTLVYPPPRFDLMNQAARLLLGTHDFDAFCRKASTTRHRVCSVEEADWHEGERYGEGYFRIVANRFLHGMVRTLVGTFLQIGHGKRSPDDIDDLLRRGDRRRAGPAAPARGLVLEEVWYPPNP